MTVVSKADLARNLEVTPSRISQYVKRGMPVRDDGGIDLELALKWLAQNHGHALNTGDRGVNRARRLTRKRPTEKRAARGEPNPMQEATDLAAIAPLFHLVVECGPRLAEAAIAAGADLSAAHAFVEIAREEIIGIAFEYLEASQIADRRGDVDQLFDVRTNDYVTPDWSALASRTGEAFDPTACEASTQALPYWADDWQPAQPALRGIS